MKPKKANWTVKVKCEVYKEVYCNNCTREQAETYPWDYAEDERETEMVDWEVLKVELNE
jgi:predicted Fe-S protein YdhL (DUF1289 family)